MIRQPLIEKDSQTQSLLRDQKISNKNKQKYASLKDKYFSTKRYIIGTNCFSTLFFTWVSPLLSFGNRFYIKQDAVPILKDSMKPEKQYDILYNNFKRIQKSNIQGVTLIKAVGASFKKTFAILLTLALFIIALGLYTPVLTDQIMKYVEQHTDRDIATGIGFFFAVFLLSFLKTVGQTHLYYHFAILGYNLSNTLSLLLFSKALKYPALCEKKFTVSQIINYSQTDAQRLGYLGYYMSSLLFTPIQLVIGIWLMYSFIGISFLSGFGMIVLIMICTFVSSKIASKGNDQLLKKKDARLKVTEQIFNIIRFIKINAMQKFFFRKLNKKRSQQLQMIKKVNTLWVLTIFLYWLSAPLILSATFATYTWLGNQITPTQAFTTIILFRILQYPLRSFPTAIAQIVQIWSSIKRVEKFLLAQQIDDRFIKYGSAMSQSKKNKDFAIQIKNGTFKWGLQQKKKDDQKKQDFKEKKQKQSKDKNKNRKNSTSSAKSKKNQSISEQKINQSQLIVNSDEGSQQMKKQSLIQSQIQKQPEQKPKFITALQDINTKFRRGQFTIIIGDIGSGKSSLLYAILNQMKCQENSQIIIDGSIAYVAQKAWIMSQTVKQNITMTLPFDQQKFNNSIKYAALQKDIQIMADGFQTQIGQKGINLSGGQKARISLARSIYCNRDIYLLDDIISAVDVHVGRFIMKETILKYLQGKTILMATHAISFAQYADQIVFMKKGKIIHKGPYQAIANTQQFKELVQIQEKRNIKQKQEDNNKNQQKINQQLELLNNFKKSKTKSIEKEDLDDLRQSAIKEQSQQNKQNQKNETKTEKLVTQLMLPQDHRKGKVEWRVYKSFIQINGGILFAIGILACMCGWVSLSTLSNIEMQKWCDDPAEQNSHLYIYLAFSISSSFFMFIRAYILIMSGIKQGTFVHKKMIKSLLYASIPNFYNRVPIGRIINRLTKDLRDLDQSVGYAVGGFLVDFFSLLSNLIICTYASSLLIIIPMLGIGLLCLKIKSFYMKTQRQIVRMESISTSPIVTGFMSAMNGLATIRAYNLQNQFLQRQFDKINTNKRMRLTRQGLQSWFSLRLTLLSFIINMSAIAYSIFSQNSSSSVAGLLLTYALTLSQDVIGVMFSLAYVQTKMVSVQRVLNFIEIQPQPGYVDYCKKWRTKEQGFDLKAIQQGKIQFQDFSVKYRENLPPALKKIELKIQSGEKVGIVGRTGAGKSTITSCLLRILDPCEGRILIDGKNIMEIKLKDLRSCITMIQQQPTLINSSIKQNLDPGNQYTVQELQKIVQQCNLKKMIDDRGGLDEIIGNDTLSVGQKQLLCICRAFLKNSKIVLIDEATANIDVKNDELIQQIISKKFTKSTVLTIAHRLSTLSNCDKILVLGQGKVLQWGNPKQLMKKQKGIFRQMNENNDQDYLK